MPSMSIYDRTKAAFFKEMDHLLLRRHRLAPFKFNRDQLSRMFFTQEEWRRVSWLMKSEARPALNTNYVGYARETSGYRFIFQTPKASDQFVCRQAKQGDDQPLHYDHELGEYFLAWEKAQAAIADENLRAWRLVHHVVGEATTWMQVKKSWPELSKFIRPFLEQQGRHSDLAHWIPKLEDVDASRARTPQVKIKEHVARDNHAVVPIMLQGIMLKPLEDKSEDEGVESSRLWDRYATRPLYTMNSVYTSSSRYGN